MNAIRAALKALEPCESNPFLNQRRLAWRTSVNTALHRVIPYRLSGPCLFDVPYAELVLILSSSRKASRPCTFVTHCNSPSETEQSA